MEEEGTSLIELTADIVSSHVTKNNVSVGDLPRLIQEVHQALASLGQPQQEPEQEAKTPAVSVRASIKPDYLVCLECGKQQKTLKRHVQNAHGMTPREYRQAYGLKADYPMVAPNYSERRSEMAKAIGLGNKGRSAGAGKAAKQNDGGSPKKRRGRKPKEAASEG